MDLVDLCEEMEALERRVKMQKHLIQQVKLEIDGEKRKQSILQGENQPMDQLDKEIEEIKRLMLEAAQRSSHQRSMGQKKTCRSSREKEVARKRSR
jgi:hypothetical protein